MAIKKKNFSYLPFFLWGMGLYFLLVSSPLLAQKKWELSFDTEQKLPFFPSMLMCEDSLDAHNQLNTILQKLHKQGFIEAYIDSIGYSPQKMWVFMNVGKCYYWKHLSSTALPASLKKAVSFEKMLEQPFSWQAWEEKASQIVEWSKNKGYPFAQVRLDSVSVKEQTIEANVYYEAGEKIEFDTLLFRGNIIVKQRFMQKYLKISPRTLFDYRKVEKAHFLLRQLPFLSISTPPQILFAYQKAYPILVLQKQKSNLIDGIVGFLPNENKEKRFVLTGQFKIQLHNLFHSGKKLHIEWASMRPKTQNLHIDMEYPLVFGLPLDAVFEFNLFKEDTSFLTSKQRISLMMPPAQWGKIGFGAGIEKTDLMSKPISPTPENIKNIDSKYNFYELLYQFKTIHNALYMRKGWLLVFKAAIGNKQIFKNVFLPPAFYENIPLQSVQFKTELQLEKYSSLSPRGILFQRLMIAYTHNKAIFENEMYRLGGLLSLRGFNQNFFFASKYAILTTEYRFFMDKNSYLYAFIDAGILQSWERQELPIGLGTGLSFGTQAGIFNFALAVGRYSQENFNITQAKIHVGFVSLF